MTTSPPSPNGSNGPQRDPRGRFVTGNRGGPGNPYAAKVAGLRASLVEAVTPGALKAIVAALMKQAQGGDVAAAKVIFERVLGPAVALDLLERLERLEALAQQQQEKMR